MCEGVSMGGKDARYDWMQGSKDASRNVPAKPLSPSFASACVSTLLGFTAGRLSPCGSQC